jgi:drug/metabolite transporter (DMT)-like permease
MPPVSEQIIKKPEAIIRPMSNIRGIAWMALAGILFAIMTGIVRHLGTDMNPIQTSFIRYAFGIVLMVPVFLRLSRAEMRSSNKKLHAYRGVIHAGGVMLWFFAMSRLPIAEVTALGFLSPIFTTIGAAIYFKETLHARRIGAVLMGFGGTLIILRPGIEVIDIGAVAQLLAAPMFAISFMMAKKMTQTEHRSSIVAYMAVFVTLALLPPALMVWRTPTMEEIFWLFLMAGVATLAHLVMTKAMEEAELTTLQPVHFLQLVWATLIGYFLFAEEPDMWTWIGGGVVVASATYIAHREALAAGRAKEKAIPE